MQNSSLTNNNKSVPFELWNNWRPRSFWGSGFNTIVCCYVCVWFISINLVINNCVRVIMKRLYSGYACTCWRDHRPVIVRQSFWSFHQWHQNKFQLLDEFCPVSGAIKIEWKGNLPMLCATHKLPAVRQVAMQGSVQFHVHQAVFALQLRRLTGRKMHACEIPSEEENDFLNQRRSDINHCRGFSLYFDWSHSWVTRDRMFACIENSQWVKGCTWWPLTWLIDF